MSQPPFPGHPGGDNGNHGVSAGPGDIENPRGPAPLGTARSYSELSAAERRIIADLVETFIREKQPTNTLEYIAAIKVRTEVLSRTRIHQMLRSKLFDNWNTRKITLSSNFKMNRGNLRESSPQISIIGQHCRDPQIRGDRAYLSVILTIPALGYSKIKFQWKLRNGLFVSHEYVDLQYGLSQEDAKHRAITAYDEHEVKRVSDYHDGVIVQLARQKLLEFRGLQPQWVPGPPNFGEAIRLDLAEDVADLLRAV
ncbi:hypothetical protein FALBO_432 [Fusarium albosuccineum]|uniref:Uncharacterized protein n=1 Tax=Fusarium albosuccineum TaxID=1237068 RepID=A0A8H4LQK5_9HYPO|nr:hypothetical protein FALBO_432 [Fusarium albosuccineum]